VCGLDGIDYPNACAAHRAGTSVLKDRECAVPEWECPNAAGGWGCGPDEFCDYPDHCGVGPYHRDRAQCVKIPTSCPSNGPPVCHCSGIVYPNECIARQSGAGVSSKTPYVDVDGQLKCDPIAGG
jgi:hypothetical protein